MKVISLILNYDSDIIYTVNLFVQAKWNPNVKVHFATRCCTFIKFTSCIPPRSKSFDWSIWRQKTEDGKYKPFIRFDNPMNLFLFEDQKEFRHSWHKYLTSNFYSNFHDGTNQVSTEQTTSANSVTKISTTLTEGSYTSTKQMLHYLECFHVLHTNIDLSKINKNLSRNSIETSNNYCWSVLQYNLEL